MTYLPRNLRFVAPLAVVHLTVYSLLNHFPLLPSRRLPLTALDRWIPFWTWTVWLYFLLIAMAIVLPLLVRDGGVFRWILGAYGVSMTTAVLFFLLWPTEYPRPAWPLDDSWHSAAYRWLTLVDTPQCCFPSAHVIVPALACTGLWRDGRRGGLWLPLLVATCTLAILTTKQHYVWDLFGGLAAAALGMALSRRVVRGGSRSKRDKH